MGMAVAWGIAGGSVVGAGVSRGAVVGVGAVVAATVGAGVGVELTVVLAGVDAASASATPPPINAARPAALIAMIPALLLMSHSVSPAGVRDQWV